MSHSAEGDGWILSKAAEAFTEMLTDADRDATNLDSFRAAILRRPKSAMRDFAVQSLDRMILKHTEARSALGPCQRMVTQYLEKADG